MTHPSFGEGSVRVAELEPGLLLFEAGDRAASGSALALGLRTAAEQWLRDRPQFRSLRQLTVSEGGHTARVYLRYGSVPEEYRPT
jgi:hypothetical protein